MIAQFGNHQVGNQIKRSDEIFSLQSIWNIKTK